MSLVWRLTKARHARTTLSGEGARLAGGRWNARGTRVVYTASSVSLATLETLVHAGPGQLLAADLVLVEIESPDGLPAREVAPHDLPAGWRDYPAPEELQRIGEQWIREKRTAILRVPSAVVPSEWNVLLDPAHEDFASIGIRSVQPFDADPRLRR